MILINLLPHREERRKRRKAAFFAGLGVSVVVGLAVAGVWYAVLDQLTSAQRSRNEFLSAEIKRLEKPELVEIKATSAAQRRLFDFSMRVTLKRPQAAAAAGAASAAASAAAAGKP